jgi:hypothetical protein
MKKINSLLLAGLGIFAMASCSKEIDVVETQETPEIANKEVVLTFTGQRPQLANETRTEWNDEANTIFWSEGDKIKVGFTFGGAWWAQSAAYSSENESPNNRIKFYQSGDVSRKNDDFTIGTFEVPTTFEGPTTSGDFVFYTVYPSALIDNNLDSAPSATVTLKTSQTPGDNTFDPTTDIMVGTSAAITSTGLPEDPIGITWNRVVGHAALTFSNMAFEGNEVPSKITLTFDNDAKVAGSFTVNISDATIGEGSDNKIILEGSGLTVDGSSINAWATVLPVSFSSLDVEVKTDKAIYTRSITGLSKEFKRNARNTLKINMATATRTAQTQYEWVKKNLSEITSSDVFVIVGNNGNDYAMSNDKGTTNPPEAVLVTIANNKLTVAPAEKLQWTLSKDGNNYTFYPNGTTATWLYCYNDNNGVRVGTNANKVFTLDAGYLKNTGSSRYVGVYNSRDWRCYTSSTATNIKNQTFAFYVKSAKKEQIAAPASVTAAINSSDNTVIDVAFSTVTGAASYVIEATPTTGTTVTKGDVTTSPATIDIANDGLEYNTEYTISVYAIPSNTTQYSNSNPTSAPDKVTTGNVPPMSLPYIEDFATDQGDFNIDNVTGSGIWTHASDYMKATSYISGSNSAAESWLISPYVQIPALTTGETVKLKFDQCINKYFGTIANEATLWVKVLDGSWTKVDITYPELGESTFSSFETQVVDLTSYADNTIQFAFKYVGATSAAGTWEIKNVTLKKYDPLALTSIAVSGQKTNFTQGDSFSFGGTVTATYNDDSTADVTTSASFTGYDMSETGEQTVTVSYTYNGVTKTTTYTINVAAPGQTQDYSATINFGNNGTKINKAEVTGNDSQGNTWTVTTAGTTSYTQNTSYSQVGKSAEPATSITFTTTLSKTSTIKSLAIRLGGFSNTAGSVNLKVGETTIGSGSLNGTSDVTVSSTSTGTGTVLSITITNIARGVKVYGIDCTYNN